MRDGAATKPKGSKIVRRSESGGEGKRDGGQMSDATARYARKPMIAKKAVCANERRVVTQGMYHRSDDGKVRKKET